MNGNNYQNYEINKINEIYGFTMKELDKRKLKQNFGGGVNVNQQKILNSQFNKNMINNKLNEINRNIISKDVIDPFFGRFIK